MPTFQCRSCLKLNYVEADHRFIHGSHFRSIEGFAFFHPNFTVFQNLTKILGWVGGFTHVKPSKIKRFFGDLPLIVDERIDGRRLDLKTSGLEKAIMRLNSG